PGSRIRYRRVKRASFEPRLGALRHGPVIGKPYLSKPGTAAAQTSFVQFAAGAMDRDSGSRRRKHIDEENPMESTRKETDSLGVVEVPADKLWGAQTQRSLEHCSIGKDLIPREMITAYATLKKAAAIANHDGKRLDDQRYKLILQTCDEILGGQHHDMFP